MPKIDKAHQFEYVFHDLRLSYPALFEPEQGDGEGGPRFKANLIIDPKVPAEKEQLLFVKGEIDKLWQKMMEDPTAKTVRDKTGLKKEGPWVGYKDMWYISAARPAKTKQGLPNPPRLVDRKNVDLKSDSTELYAGCRVDAKIRFYTHWHAKSGYRVNASIEVVRKRRDDTPFGAGPASLDDMPLVDDAPDADNLDLDESDDGL